MGTGMNYEKNSFDTTGYQHESAGHGELTRRAPRRS